MLEWPISTGALRKTSSFALILALSALAAIAFFSERDWRDFELSRREGQIASSILDLDQRIMGLVTDAETGQRGYLLTGRSQYLEPYHQARRSLPASLHGMRDLVTDQDAQLKNILRLETMIPEKLAELQAVMDTQDSKGVKAARTMVAAGHGQELMDEIRQVSSSIATEAELRWTNSRTSMRLNTAEARFVTMGGVVLLALLVIAAFAANERSARQRESLIADLAESNRASGQVRELLRTTFYSIGDGVITTDAAGAVELMNSVAEKVTGWPEAEARGKPVEEVFRVSGAEPGASISPVRAALTRDSFQSAGLHCRIESKSGAESTVEGGAAPIHDDTGRLRGSVLVFRDVTELRRSEERLRQVAKLESMGVLAGGIAHDFNNLLVGIVGTAGLLEDYFPPGAPGRELVDTLRTAGDRASKLTNQMLAYSGRGRFVIRALDLSHEVEEIRALVKASIPKNVTLHLSLARELPKVDADPAQIQQLIMNLLINAAEAVGEACGAVAVSTATQEVGGSGPANVLGDPIPPGNYVLLSVSDTGHGMDEATRARIFDPFFTTKFTGRGLGLAATLGIVKGHRGAIEVESAPGRGATFRVYFPVANAASAASS